MRTCLMARPCLSFSPRLAGSRAIGGARTFTSPDSQHCQLLLSPRGSPKEKEKLQVCRKCAVAYRTTRAKVRLFNTTYACFRSITRCQWRSTLLELLILATVRSVARSATPQAPGDF